MEINSRKRYNKKELVEKAKRGDAEAELLLLEINQLGILEEAKNPDTSEEIAIEMLAELSLSPLINIRKKAIALLIKLVPEKIKEKLIEGNVNIEDKENILSTMMEISDQDIYLYYKLYETEEFPPKLKEKILDKIKITRKELEKNASEIMQLHNQIEELETIKKDKFRMIEDLYKNFKTLNTENIKSNKIFHDFKMDVDLSYQSLRTLVTNENK